VSGGVGAVLIVPWCVARVVFFLFLGLCFVFVEVVMVGLLLFVGSG
jgi:hypothetical protein